MLRSLCGIVALLAMVSIVQAEMLKPVPFTDVKLSDKFWAPRQGLNRTVTIWHNFKMCEETGRIRNFDKAAGRMQGAYEGLLFNDSDVYKVMEAAAYALATEKDEKLDKYMDDLIGKLAAAQQKDGYLNTYYILKAGLDKRWSKLSSDHELYCAGHLIEGAVAHFQATGKRNFLDVAVKVADNIDATFGPGRNMGICGHEEIEIALVKLYKVTSEKRYLNLAKFFIDQRGTENGRKRWGEYCQDHKPLLEQDKAVGHAVRFGYFMTGASDIVLATGDQAYVPALNKLWENVNLAKLYITGGIGARGSGEAFGEDFELPNESAYAETCAGISNAMWNQRMNLIHGDAKYVDMLERVLYNGFLSGLSLSGDRFYYVNPLAGRGGHRRVPWFGCACCPPNVARVLASLSGYFYATAGDTVYVNLYASGTAKIKLGDKSFTLEQQTNYPWDGEVKLTFRGQGDIAGKLALRIPAWVKGKPEVLFNDEAAEIRMEKGYAILEGSAKDGDVVTLKLPMPAERVYADPRVKANVGRVAIQRGPVVYCIEAADNAFRIPGFYLPKDQPLTVARTDVLGGVPIITGKGRVRGQAGEAAKEAAFTAIPYYAWNNREDGRMTIWLAEDPAIAQALVPPTLASQGKVSVSYRGNGDGPVATNDQLEPKSSNDHEVPRLTYWPHKGTEEWAVLTLKEKAKVSSTSVYWFDDTGTGECRVPASCKLQYKSGEEWKDLGAVGVEKDKFNTVKFDAVETPALRLVIKLPEKMSTGILEWKVE